MSLMQLQPGDILALRADKLPPSPWWVTLAFNAIAVAETLIDHAPKYVHIALVDAPNPDGSVKAIEELPNGCDLTTEPIDSRWDIYRVNWKDPGDAQKLVAWCQARLGTSYNYLGLPILGIERLLNLPGVDNEQTNICSTIVAEGLFSLQYNCWDMQPSKVAPSDYPGRDMNLLV